MQYTIESKKKGVTMSETTYSSDISLDALVASLIQQDKADAVLQIGPDFAFSQIPSLPVYDMIILRDVAEHLEADEIRLILEWLLKKVRKQVLLITPEYCAEETTSDSIHLIRKYHPLAFIGFDFAYSLHNVKDTAWQIYNIFPPRGYPALPCDPAADTGQTWRTSKASDQPQNPSNITGQPRQRLRIAYIIPHHNITGGVKALLQQMKHLASKGHIVKAYYKKHGLDRKPITASSTTSAAEIIEEAGMAHTQRICAIPAWSDLSQDDISEQHVLREDQSFLDVIQDVDVIILAWPTFIPEFENANVPVLLWEQGSPEIFGDFGQMLFSGSHCRFWLHYLYRRPVHLLAVSPILIEILQKVYNRKALYFPNGIDTDFYRPGRKADGLPAILMMGSPYAAFKGTAFALEVFRCLWDVGARFQVWWASPQEFTIQGAMPPYSLNIILKPPQEKLAELCRQATLFFSCSLYESFPLPPLEAMSSGTAVVATDNGGIHAYARPDENCILIPQGDTAAAVSALQMLLEDEPARKALEKAGREAALEHTFDRITDVLEDCLYRVCLAPDNL